MALVEIKPASSANLPEQTGRLPQGILYLGDALQKSSFDVKIFHVREKDISPAAREIVRLNPLFVGVSTMTKRAGIAARMSKEIKSLRPRQTIVWGGIHPSVVPEQCLRTDYVDAVCIGEGEQTVVELAEALSSKRPLNDVRGLAFLSDGEIVYTPERPMIQDLDEHRMDLDLVHIEEYVVQTAEGPMVYFTSSRGCPHSCTFCYVEVFHKRRWRCHSAEFVVDELKRIKDQTGITAVVFDDSEFAIQKSRALQIIQQLGEINIRVLHMLIRIDDMTEDFVESASRFGVKSWSVGLETGSDRMQKRIRKNYLRNTVVEKAKLMSHFPEITWHVSSIIGLPGEMKGEVRQTIDLLLELADIHYNTIFTSEVFVPMPGNEEFRRAVGCGFSPPQDAEGWARYDYAHQYDLPWLDWADSKNKKELFTIPKYVRLLGGGVTLGKKSRVLLLCRRILRSIAKYRLRNSYFGVPIELHLINLAKRLKLRYRTSE